MADENSDGPLRYCGVDIVGLGREEADRLSRWVNENLGLQCIIFDPQEFLTLHMDRETVAALRSQLSSDPISQGMAEDFDDWLAWADAYTHDDAT